jgi:hypothetical protein
LAPAWGSVSLQYFRNYRRVKHGPDRQAGAIQEALDGRVVDWLEKVTDEACLAGPRDA